MKKIIYIVLIVFILCSACSNEISYDVRVAAGMEENVFDKSIKVYNSEKFQEIKIPEAIKENFNLGKKEVSADLYSKKIYEHKGQKNIYQSTDGNVEYWKNIDNICFGIKAKNNYSLSKYEGIELTENQFIEHIKAYLDMYLDTNEYKNYVYSCVTSVVISKENATWKEEKKGFYKKKDDSETVSSYHVEYQRYYNDLPTADKIIILCDKDGNIKALYNYKYNVNWSDSNFKQDKINLNLQQFLKKYVNKEYTVVGHKVESQCLVYMDQDIKLSIMIEMTLKINEEEFVTLCPLILSEI